MVLGLSQNVIYFSQGINFVLTDCSSLSWISKYKFASQQIFNWSTFLCSLSIEILALPNTSRLIAINDMFCRPRADIKQKIITGPKLNPNNPEALPILDFAGVPPLKITAVFEILDKFHKVVGNLAPEKIKKTWDQFISTQHGFAKMAEMNYLSGRHLIHKNPQDIAWKIVSLGGKVNRISKNKEQAYFNLVQVLAHEFPKFKHENLLNYQKEDPLCQKHFDNPQSPFLVINELLFKNTGQEIYQAVVPKSIAFDLVQKLHQFSSVFHLGRQKLKSLVNKTFYIQNFKAVFDKVMSLCQFCFTIVHYF